MTVAAEQYRGHARAPGWMHSIDRVVDVIVVAALVSELLVVLVDISSRSFFGFSIVWGQEVAQLALTTMAFIGGAAAYRRGQQLSVSAVVDRLPDSTREIVRCFTEIVIVATSALIAVGTWPILTVGWSEYTPVLQIAETWMTLPVTIGMILFAMEGVAKLAKRPINAVFVSLFIFALTTTLLIATRPVWSTWMQNLNGMTLVLMLFLVMLAIGLPISFVLVVSAGIYIVGGGNASLSVLPRQMNDAVGSFILLAVPFFVCAGLIMVHGGLGRRISALFDALIGHLRGGPLQVIVVTMYIFSGLSGSKAADMAAVGGTMKGMAKSRGYSGGEIGAVLAASAVMGETIPPSIALLVLGSVTTLSILTLFVAGLVPALVLGVALMGYNYFRSLAAGIPKATMAPAAIIAEAALDAALPMLLPVLLIGGVLTGFATPTEISALAVVYSLLLSVVFYREIGARDIWKVLIETTTMSGMILFIISSAAPFSWSMSFAQVPDAIARLIAISGGNQPLFMIGTIIALVVTGALLESLPALIIFAPLLLPVATSIGIDPIQYGIVLILSMGIGAFTPPLGVGVYIACVVTETTIEEVTKPLLGYLTILLLAVILVAIVPWFSLALPAFFGLL